MTLLVSQTEALKGELKFPFVHDFQGSLHYGELAKQVLTKNEVPHVSDIYVQDGKAAETVTITFLDVEQVVAFLAFEKRYVTAELRKEELSNLPKKRLFKRTAKHSNGASHSRLSKSYADVISMLTSSVEKKIKETVKL